MDRFENKCGFFRKEEMRCPYCGKAVRDKWEDEDYDDDNYMCEHCGKQFELNKEKTFVYTTYRKEDKDTLHLCSECIFDFATCKKGKIEFGNGYGNDNVIMCENFQSKRESKNEN